MPRLWSEYLIPSTVQEALDALLRYKGQARIIAGGTDLIIRLKQERCFVPAVVDVGAIEGLKSISLHGGEVVIGAAVTCAEALGSPVLRERAPHLVEAIGALASAQIRNLATLVGNVVNASPAGDTIPPLLTLEARVVIQGPSGRREQRLEEFLLGPGQITLAPVELVTHLRFPLPASGHLCAFEKLGLRRAMSIAVNNAVVMLWFDDARVTEARIALGAIAPTVVRARQAEGFLLDRELDGAVITQAGALAKAATCPIDDIRGSAEYRAEMASALVRRALGRIESERRKPSWPGWR